MPRRPQVPNLPDAPETQPASSPVQTFYAPRLPAPVLQNLVDLSPLSDTLAKILDVQQQRKSEQATQMGVQAFGDATDAEKQDLANATKGLTDAEERRRANQEAWAKLVAKKQIPEWASPWARVGFMESSARQIVGQYARDLDKRLADVSTVIDPQTNLPKEPDRPDKIISQEWAKYADNGILSDYYGGRVGQELRQRAEEGFKDKAARAVGAQIVTVRKQQMSNEVGNNLLEWATKDSGPTPLDYEAFNQYIRVEMRLKSIADPRDVVMQGLKFAAATLANTDAGEAIRVLHQAQNIQVGNTTLGADADTGEEIAKLVERYEAQKEHDDRHELELKPAQLQEDIRSGERTYMEELLKAKNTNGSILGKYNELDARFAAEKPWGENTPIVRNELRKYAESLAGSTFDDATSFGHLEDQIALGVNLDSLAGQIRVAPLSGESKAKLQKQLEARSNNAVTDLLENNPGYVNTLNRLSAAAHLPGVSPEIGARYAQDDETAFVQLQRSAVEYAKSIAGQPGAVNLMREWADKQITPLVADRQKRNADILSHRTEAFQKVADVIAHRGDATPLLSQNAQWLTLEERQGLQKQSDNESNRTRFFSTEPFQQAEEELQHAISVKLDELGEPVNSALRDAWTADFKRELRGKASAWLTENLPKMAPKDQLDLFNQAMGEISGEVFKSVSGKDVSAMSDKMKAGKSFTEVVESERENATQLASAKSLGELSLTDLAKKLTATGGGYRNNLVSDYFARAQENFIKKPDHPFTNVVNRGWYEAIASSEVNEILKRTDIDDTAKAQAVASIYGPTGGIGIQDVLNNSIPSLTKFQQDKAEEIAWYASGTYSKEQSLAWLSERSKLTLPLKGVKLEPYVYSFFRNLDDLHDWVDNRQDELRKASALLGVPPEGFRDWMKFQRATLDRTNHDQ